MLARAAVAVLVGAVAIVALASGPSDAAAPAGPRLAFLKLRHDPTRFELSTVNPSGEAYRRVLPLSLPRGRRFVGFDSPAWSADGSLLAFRTVAKRPALLSIVSSDGSGRRLVPHTRGGFLPLFSPNGHTLAFSRFRRNVFDDDSQDGRRSLTHREYESSSVWTVDLVTGERQQLTPWRDGLDQYASSYSPDGSTLLLTRFDEARSGEAELVALSADGGHPKLLVGEGMLSVYSPDGSKIALFRRHRRWEKSTGSFEGGGALVDENTELYVIEADGTGLRRLTHTPGRDEFFVSWDPSGERLAYLQFHPGSSESASAGFGNSIMQINADGSCESEILSARHTAFYGPAWQPGPGHEAGRIDC